MARLRLDEADAIVSVSMGALGQGCEAFLSPPICTTRCSDRPSLCAGGEAKSTLSAGVASDGSKSKESGSAPAAAEKRKLQPVSAASVNSRLQQPLKSLITKKDSSTAKPQLVAVIGKSKENGNGATVSARDKNPPPVRPPFT